MAARVGALSSNLIPQYADVSLYRSVCNGLYGMVDTSTVDIC